METPTESARWRRFRSTKAPASLCASASCYRLAEDVGLIAVVKTKLKFRQVQWEILLGYVVIGSHNPALQECPERIQIRGMDFAAYIFALHVIYGFMREFGTKMLVAYPLIGRDQFNFVTDGLAHKSFKRSCASILDDLADHVTLSADCPDNPDLTTANTARPAMPALAGMLILFLPADERFVYFDDSHKLAEVRVVHGSAEPMAHIEGSRIGRSDLSLNLHGANALLGVEHLPENLEPYAQRVFSVLEDRADKQREAIGIAAPASDIRALPFPRQRDVIDGFCLVATRTSWLPVRPAMKKQVLAARIVRRKSNQQLSEGHHAMKANTLASIPSIRQVLYISPN